MKNYDNDALWRRRADFAERHPIMAMTFWALLAVAGIAVVFGFVGLLQTGSVFWAGKAAKLTNPARVEQKVYDPNNTIAQVAFFHDQCTGVVRDFEVWQSNKALANEKARALRGETDPIMSHQDSDAAIQADQDATQAANALYGAAQDYNSRSAQYTANAFKDANLPYRINPPTMDRLKGWSPPNCG